MARKRRCECGKVPCDSYADGECKAVKRSRHAAWRAANPERVKHYATHRAKPEFRERDKAISLAYRVANLESVSGVSVGAIGASAELIVAADLMVRGIAVTRPLDPQATHDLHAEFKSVGWKGVQVKSVKVNTKTGNWKFNRQYAERRSPVYALVRPSTKEVRYEAGSEPLPVELQ